MKPPHLTTGLPMFLACLYLETNNIRTRPSQPWFGEQAFWEHGWLKDLRLLHEKNTNGISGCQLTNNSEFKILFLLDIVVGVVRHTFQPSEMLSI